MSFLVAPLFSAASLGQCHNSVVPGIPRYHLSASAVGTKIADLYAPSIMKETVILAFCMFFASSVR
jgi:hypothetical protein